MKSSQYLLATLREQPAEAEIASHGLMLRAGLVRRIGAGLYNWLPLGARVLSKVTAIIRQEMNAAGAHELVMPLVQPAELWQQSGRWDSSGPELARLQDRHHRDYCLAPTHEEVITALARQELTSYRQLPINLYQIQTKFRDEIRPRFGVMRAREFMMMDSYSFHTNQASLEQTYQDMYDCYGRILQRMGLEYRVVEADSGNIGGQVSHEFQVLSGVGEDILVVGDGSDYVANIERAACLSPKARVVGIAEDLQKVATPEAKSIDSVSALLGVAAAKTVKTLALRGTEGSIVAVVLRGDHSLNLSKIGRRDEIASPVELVDADELKQQLGLPAGFIGPCGLKIPLLVDHSAAHLTNFVCGANEEGYHLTGVNWGRDAEATATGDFRNITEGELCSDGLSRARFVRGIEVGHIFQLGDKYSTAMAARVLDDKGRQKALIMGCYGIGVSRMVAAFIEQNHDDKGILWSPTLCPFEVVLLPLNFGRSQVVRNAADSLYRQLINAGVEVLMDDRDERPGVKFTDSELIGIPYSVVIGDRNLAAEQVELRNRRSGEVDKLALSEIVSVLRQKLRKAG